MKKIISLFMAAIMLFMVGCSNNNNEVNSNTSEGNTNNKVTTLKFGLLPAESAIPFIVAKEKGFFEKNGLNVELTMFNSPNDRNTALQGKQLDGTIGDIMTAFSFNNAGIKMKIVSDINEDFKVIASPKSGITDIKGLDQKKVSLVPNFVLEYIMDKIAQKNNITYNIVDIPSIPARFEAVLANTVDAVVFTEPQATQLKEKGAIIVASSKEEDIKAGAILMTESYIKENNKAMKMFYKAYNEAIDYINNNSPDNYSELLKKYNFSDETVKYLKEADYDKANDISSSTFNDVLAWSKSKKLTDKDFKYEDLTDFSFVD